MKHHLSERTKGDLVIIDCTCGKELSMDMSGQSREVRGRMISVMRQAGNEHLKQMSTTKATNGI
jgi:hypothetical protein